MRDPVSGRSISAQIKHRISGADILELSEVGHYPQLEVPDRIESDKRRARMLSDKELKKLHGKEYVESFEIGQSKFRLERLIESIDFNPSYKVVDFACGNGMILPLIANNINEYIGVDFSPEFIEAANRIMVSLGILNAKFVCSDILQFCSSNKNIDVALAMDFSEHVYDEEWIKILSAIKSSLKPNGKLYLHTPNADFF